MAFEVEDGICDELSGAVEGCLSATEGFMEFGFAACSEEVLLFGGHGADFSTAAGVDWIELCGNYGRWYGGGFCWVGFVGEELGDECSLDRGCVGVRCDVWYM